MSRVFVNPPALNDHLLSFQQLRSHSSLIAVANKTTNIGTYLSYISCTTPFLLKPYGIYEQIFLFLAF